MATIAPAVIPEDDRRTEIDDLLDQIRAANPADGISAACFIRLGRLIERDEALRFCERQYAEADARAT